MNELAATLRLSDRNCLVVGGETQALHLIHTLLGANAQVTCVATSPHADIQALQQSGKLELRHRDFLAADLDQQDMIFLTTGHPSLNQRIAQQAIKQKKWLSCMDAHAIGNLDVQPTLHLDAISLSLYAPQLDLDPDTTDFLCKRLKTYIPSSFGALARFIAAHQAAVAQALPDPSARRSFWHDCIHGPVAEMVMNHQPSSAERIMLHHLRQQSAACQARQPKAERVHLNPLGEVWLVGAGPGDPDLLTLRALRLIQRADVVIYDRLVDERIMSLIPSDCERIYAGKRRKDHCITQHNLNALLVQMAQQGKRVLRLKGGDPFIFGRGGEELEWLREHDIAFQIVPGITAASGCAAYAGIPLTHRQYAHSCIFVTANSKNHDMNLNWQTLIQPMQTLVVYMVVHNLEMLRHNLLKHGMNPSTPLALINQGTTAQQRVWIRDVGSLNAQDLARADALEGPTLMIIGDVVRLRDKLAWFE